MWEKYCEIHHTLSVLRQNSEKEVTKTTPAAEVDNFFESYFLFVLMKYQTKIYKFIILTSQAQW